MGIVFIGTPAFAVPSLRRLAAAGHDISVVITQPDRPAGRGRRPQAPPVKLVAEELGLAVLQPETLRSAEVLDKVRSLAPECCVAVAYGQILRPEFLKIAPQGVLNVHPSLLPMYRGPSPIPAAILNGEEVTGVTIMLMDAGMDSGPILAQREMPIRPEDTAGTLTDKLAEAGADLLTETLPRWLNGEIKAQPQDHSLATKTSLLRKEDGRIDWQRPAVEIWRQVRADNPWPGAFTTLDGDLLHIWHAWPLPSKPRAEAGVALQLTRDEWRTVPALAYRSDRLAGLAVQTGEGLLVPILVQRSGRRRLDAGEFLRGTPALIGRRLGLE